MDEPCVVHSQSRWTIRTNWMKSKLVPRADTVSCSSDYISTCKVYFIFSILISALTCIKYKILRGYFPLPPFFFCSWWHHEMETFFALLAISAGNSPVTGEFPAQRPMTRSFNVFFGLRLNIRLSEQPRGWWFETQSRPLWCHCNVIGMDFSGSSPLWLMAREVAIGWHHVEYSALPITWYLVVTFLQIAKESHP